MNSFTSNTNQVSGTGRQTISRALIGIVSSVAAGLVSCGVFYYANNYINNHKTSSANNHDNHVAVTPDPRFSNIKIPKLPAVTVQGAQQVVIEMQNAYRCMHPANWQSTQLSMPKDAGDAPVSLEELADSLKQSLGALPDACYVTSVLPQITNPRTPAPLMKVYYDDLTHRPDPIKLRGYFLVAGIQSHPYASRALGDLRTAMNADYGDDWMRWDEAISEHLSREMKGSRGVSCRYH